MSTRKLILNYTLLFGITAFLVFLWFFLTGRTLIWHVDGLLQYYNALIFYGDHLRSVLHTVFVEGSLNVPSYSFSIGEGEDIFTTMHFYGIGAPLNLLAVFFNADNMYILYDAVSIARLYLAGLAFIALCREIGIKTGHSILAGSLAYAFSLYCVENAACQTPFLLACIVLPLVITGTEKVLKGKKPNVLITAVFLSAVTNLYLFYAIVVMTVMYAVLRTVILFGKDLKAYLVPARNMFVYSLLGTLAAGIIVVPVAYTFLSDDRISGGSNMHLFYPLEYYTSLPKMIISPYAGLELHLCIIPVSLLAVLYLFSRKALSKTLLAVNIITIIFVLVPFFGQLFNGMSYMSYRWTFEVALAASVTLSYAADKMQEDRRFFKVNGLILCGIFLVLCIITGELFAPGVIAALIELIVFTLIMGFVPEKRLNEKNRGRFLVVFTCICIYTLSFYLNSAGGYNSAAESTRPSEIEAHFQNDGPAARELLAQHDGFYRYSGQELTMNAALNNGVSTPLYYWSTSNPASARFNRELGLIHYVVHKYPNMDDRTIMTDLCSVLYYIVPEGADVIPYGYENINSDIYEGHDIYINTNPIGISFSSANAISESDWIELTPGQREEVLLYSVVVPDDDMNSHTSFIPDLQSTIIPVTGDVVFDDHYDLSETPYGFSVSVEGLPNSETRLNVAGAEHNGVELASIVIRSSSGVIKVMDIGADGYMFYNGRGDFTVNLGFHEEPVDRIDFVFVDAGTYDFDSITVECIPMDNTTNAIDDLNEDTLENVVIGTDLIEGDIELDEDKILVLTIPYSSGWTATVDGEEYPIIAADIKYMGLDLPAGSHHITLTYKTPYFNAGVMTSAAGIIILAVLYIVDKKKSRASR